MAFEVVTAAGRMERESRLMRRTWSEKQWGLKNAICTPAKVLQPKVNHLDPNAYHGYLPAIIVPLMETDPARSRGFRSDPFHGTGQDIPEQ